MNKTTKPAKPIRLASATKEEQEMQIARFLANKKENFFQLILANLLQNPKIVRPLEVTIEGPDGIEHERFNIEDIVNAAIEGADYALTKLYPVEKKED